MAYKILFATLIVLLAGYWLERVSSGPQEPARVIGGPARAENRWEFNDDYDDIRTGEKRAKRFKRNIIISDGGNSNDFKAMCLLNREPSLSKGPDMHFFSNQIRSSQASSSSSSSCKAQAISISLNLTRATTGNETEDGGSFSWQNLEQSGRHQVEQIQQKLLAPPNVYKRNVNTYVLIHGYSDDWLNETWLCQLKDTILDKSQANVFILDWSGGSKPKFKLDYGLATTNIKQVAEMAGSFIQDLIELSSNNSGSGGSTFERDASLFHLIGHSLGAHLAGFIGYKLNGSIGRITALDPAGPCFRRTVGERSSADARQSGYLDEQNSSRRRLSASSAKLVTALHSDITLAGLNENCAHYDIYLNGGAQQPNCSSSSILTTDPSCNHMGSHRVLFDTPAADERKLFAGYGLFGSQQAESDPNRCYAMSYECDSWSAFKAGECGGSCRDQDDASCLFAGLYLGPRPLEPATNLWQDDSLDPGSQVSSSGDSSVPEQQSFSNSDSIFNEEGDSSAPDQETDTTSNLAGDSRHFTRSGVHPVCLYQYQIIVATRREAALPSQRAVTNNPYYLQIPLGGSIPQTPAARVAATGQRPRYRLVQVSHAVGPAGTSRLTKNLGSIVNNNNNNNNNNLLTNGPYDYYTALITFNSSNENSCQAFESRTQSSPCNLLGQIDETQLFSSNADALQRVQWVALNYLSGLRESAREINSQTLLANQTSGIRLSSGNLNLADIESSTKNYQALRKRRSLYTSFVCFLTRSRANNCNPLNYYVTLNKLTYEA